MLYTRLSLVLLAAVMTLPVFADGVVDDCIKLSQGGVGEEVTPAELTDALFPTWTAPFAGGLR